MDKPLNILWLPGWFPSRVDMLVGDFIERHAKAVSSHANVTVLYVTKDTSLKVKSEIIKEQSNGLTVYRGYYAGRDSSFIFYKAYSFIQHLNLLNRIYKKAEQENKKFDLCHVHIPLRQALLALWLKRKKQLNYVVSEQNSWYMPGDRHFFSQSFLIKYFIKKIFKRASAVHVVSQSLGQQLLNAGIINKTFIVIPNVVNTDVFKLDAIKTVNNTTRFITISGHLFQKNTDGIIRAFALFINKGFDAMLHVAGPGSDTLKELSKKLDIEKKVVFHGIVTNEKIAELNQQADAMIFFTRFETFGCVMAESICCGVPVIASRLPVLEENLSDGINALLVNPEDEEGLAEKMALFVQKKNTFNKQAIAATATAKYNYEEVAQQFIAFYQQNISSP